MKNEIESQILLLDRLLVTILFHIRPRVSIITNKQKLILLLIAPSSKTIKK